MSNTKNDSYSQILNSTLITGSAQGINLLIGLIRTKIVAVLLGPSGVGLIGLYQSTIGMIGTVSGLGINASGVRQVAEAASSGERDQVAKTACVLRRVSWLTGVLGLVLTVALALPLSLWAFNDASHSAGIAILGISLLFTTVSGGQTALIRGMRRLRDWSRVLVLSAIYVTIASAAIYLYAGARGIIPLLIVASIITCCTSAWYANKIDLPNVRPSWAEVISAAKALLTMGLAFVISGIMLSCVAFLTRSMILTALGIEANGIYQAAWGASGLFVGFIMQAMGNDFYPRLTGASKDNAKILQLVNEQTEVGVLISLPALLAMIIYAPLIITVLYTSQFNEASQMLPWFGLGLLGRVISWPMGYILLAKECKSWFIVSEAAISGIHVVLIWAGLKLSGLNGVALAYAAMYAIYILTIKHITHRVCGFAWTKAVERLALSSLLCLCATIAIVVFMQPFYALIIGTLITLTTAIICADKVSKRLASTHVLTKMANKLRFGNTVK